MKVYWINGGWVFVWKAELARRLLVILSKSGRLYLSSVVNAGSRFNDQIEKQCRSLSDWVMFYSSVKNIFGDDNNVSKANSLRVSWAGKELRKNKRNSRQTFCILNQLLLMSCLFDGQSACWPSNLQWVV